MSNFDFLSVYWKDLASLGAKAEYYLYTEPNTSVITMSEIADKILITLLNEEKIGIPANKDTQPFRIEAFKSTNKLSPEAQSIFYRIEQSKTAICDENFDISIVEAQRLLIDCFNICCWFSSFYNVPAPAGNFEMPQDTRQTFENEAKVHDLGAQQREEKKSKKKKGNTGLKIATAVMCVLFTLSVLVNIYQYTSDIGLLDYYETVNGYKLMKFDEVDFYSSHVLIDRHENSSRCYHRFWCDGADISNGYKVVSIKKAKELGYTPCPRCFGSN